MKENKLQSHAVTLDQPRGQQAFQMPRLDADQDGQASSVVDDGSSGDLLVAVKGASNGNSDDASEAWLVAGGNGGGVPPEADPLTQAGSGHS